MHACMHACVNELIDLSLDAATSVWLRADASVVGIRDTHRTVRIVKLPFAWLFTVRLRLAPPHIVAAVIYTYIRFRTHISYTHEKQQNSKRKQKECEKCDSYS
jgi:hypothetical protein